MKVNEITEGWGNILKTGGAVMGAIGQRAGAFGRGFIGAHHSTGSTFVKDFVKAAQDGIRTGIQNGTISSGTNIPEAMVKPTRPFKRAVTPRPAPVATPTLKPTPPAKTQTIGEFLLKMVSAYMGPGSWYGQGGTVDISAVKDLIKKQISAVEQTYGTNQGAAALTALGNTLYAASTKSRDTQAASPSRITPTDLTK